MQNGQDVQFGELMEFWNDSKYRGTSQENINLIGFFHRFERESDSEQVCKEKDIGNSSWRIREYQLFICVMKVRSRSNNLVRAINQYTCLHQVKGGKEYSTSLICSLLYIHIDYKIITFLLITQFSIFSLGAIFTSSLNAPEMTLKMRYPQKRLKMRVQERRKWKIVILIFPILTGKQRNAILKYLLLFAFLKSNFKQYFCFHSKTLCFHFIFKKSIHNFIEMRRKYLQNW